MNKYELLIEHIINDNEKAARELFHQIVVEKSRDIYESLMDEEMGGNPANQFIDDIGQDVQQDDQGLEEEEGDEELDLGDDDEEFDLDSDDDGDVSGDFPADDDGEEMSDEEQTDRILDLEDELESLKAEFERLVGGEGGSGSGGADMGGDDEFDMDEEGEGEMMETMQGSGKSGSGSGSGEDDMMEAKKSKKDGSGKSGSGKSGSGKSGSGKPFEGKEYPKSQAEIMKEYVNKVKDFYKGDAGEGHEVGDGGSVPVNHRSLDQPKNDMGGSAGNLNQGGANADPSGTPPAKTAGVLKKGDTIDVAKRNVNQVGGNKGAQNFYSKKETSWEKAHGKEGQTTDGSVPVSKDSLLRRR